MPPQISDGEEGSEVEDYPTTVKEQNVTKTGRGKAMKEVEETQESLMVESDKEESEGEEDEEPGPDEYVVEAITSHLIEEETGQILYQVKWEGYEKKSDRTWEPEVNLETAPAILEAYLSKIGGKELLIEQWAEKKAAIKGKKRGRASTGTNGSAAKKTKRNGAIRSASPPAGVTATDFKPPTGSWEEEVVLIDACEGGKGKVIVFLTWKGGEKTQHPLNQVYKRCPQKMLKFYESHLVFKRNDD